MLERRYRSECQYIYVERNFRSPHKIFGISNKIKVKESEVELKLIIRVTINIAGYEPKFVLLGESLKLIKKSSSNVSKKGSDSKRTLAWQQDNGSSNSVRCTKDPS